ncbi:penicillin-binding protein [Brevibacillus formosus]|uniref:Penicillin-binding protein n=1 Tax=Brevibacillus formosus TaxID=54913 RepID=A0A220MD73_9BACL|nr:serine hydrolase domain-containing protein [Brevibacillus formosus]ASJ52600.1 penicillin-binding protein [Brevibacillus formosus]
MDHASVSALEGLVQQFMEKEKVPGLSIGISRDGETIYQKGFGVTDLGTNQPVTPETIFGIASVTKSFTAAAIMQLVAEDKLSIEDPIRNYLPDLQGKGNIHTDKITIHHLLSHTSGVPPLLRREELTRLPEHIAYLNEVQFAPLGVPGEYISYSNDMFLLLGAIIERVTGQRYRTYVTERLLAPLEMNRSTYDLEEVARFADVSVPYVKGEEQQLKKVPWPTLGNYEVGGGIRSCVVDLLKYGQLYVNAGRYQEKQVADGASLRAMWQPVHRLTKDAWYGYALKITPHYAGITLVEHGGGQPGVSSNFGFVPEKGLVVTVLSNLENVPIQGVWLAAVNAALGLPLAHKEDEAPLYTPTREELEKLVGTYKSGEGGRLRLFLRDDAPVAEVAGMEYALRASSHDTLIDVQNGQPLRFFFKKQQQAWAVLMGLRMLCRSEEKF